MRIDEIQMFDNIFKHINDDNKEVITKLFNQGILVDYLYYLFDEEKVSSFTNVLNFIIKDAILSTKNHKSYKDIITKINKKGVTQIVIPSSNLRVTKFNVVGMPSIYDDLPKKMGFEKIRIKDSIWYDKIDTNENNIEGSSAWVLNGLNENFNNRT